MPVKVRCSPANTAPGCQPRQIIHASSASPTMPMSVDRFTGANDTFAKERQMKPRSKQIWTVIAPVAVVLGAALCVGCAARDAMSVEEAKKVTVAFSGSRFVPPPRTTNDIVALLDQQRMTESDSVRELRRQADRPTPVTRDASALLQRGVAARDLGRAQQSVQDL